MRVAAEPAFRTRHANPYNALLYDAVVARGVEVREFDDSELDGPERPDIVHLHWPELQLLSSHREWQSRQRLKRFEKRITRAQQHGTRLVWTAHNEAAHETRGLAHELDELLARHLDGVFALSEAGERVAHERFPGVPVFRTPHGHYRSAYPFGGYTGGARAELGIETGVNLLVAIGQVRPYKNLPALVAALAETDDPALRVAIAGAPDGSEAEAQLRAAAAADPRLLLDLDLLDEHRVATWLRAADGVVLPYRRILNSGAALLALSAGRPVTVPAIGAMPELAVTVGADWVRTYLGEFTAQTLQGAAAWSHIQRHGIPDLSAYGWDGIAAATVDGYQRVLDTPRRNP